MTYGYHTMMLALIQTEDKTVFRVIMTDVSLRPVMVQDRIANPKDRVNGYVFGHWQYNFA